MEEKIKKTIKNILSFLSFEEKDITIDIYTNGSTDLMCVRINTNDGNSLIGNAGVNLMALDHLVKKILEKELGERPKFLLDVNDFQKNKIDLLKQKVGVFADRARSFKSSVEMDPMSPYERMIVHSLIAKERDLKTESIGFGRDRYVKITYQED